MNFIDRKEMMPSLKTIRAMSKPEVQDYLIQRGFDPSWKSKKEMLETAVDDWKEEHGLNKEVE